MNDRSPSLSRRAALTRAGAFLGAAATLGPGVAAGAAAETAVAKPEDAFLFCLNTATIRGQKLGLAREAEVAAKAGFHSLEPWVDSIDGFAKSGGSLSDLKARIRDLGLTVESAIGFAEWLAEDDARRAKGLERAKRDMDLVAQLGGKRLASPPSGATDRPVIELPKIAERYRTLLELGDQMGVVPELELWGFSQNLHRLSECAFVALATAHPSACVLADVFHLYKGGSDFRGVRLLSGQALPVFHMNDYPSDPPRDKINDSFRVFPGDGTAPLVQLLRDLASTGGRKVLSLELFNRQYWEQEALDVARTGLDKMKAVVRKSLSGATAKPAR